MTTSDTHTQRIAKLIFALVDSLHRGKKISLILLSLCLHLSVVAQENQQPNIIFILTDDMGFADLACNGGTLVPTPNIDKLAKEGTRFTQYYSGSPICSPSRTALMTGQYPAKWHITSYLQTKKGNRACEQADFVSLEAPSVARLLKTAGYKTAHFGKWHMGGGRDVIEAPSIEKYGYDEWASTWESPNPDPLITATNWIWADKDSIKRWDRSQYFVDKTLAFMEKHKGKPCYVNLWPDDVHTPWVPDSNDLANFTEKDLQTRKFQAVLAEYDAQVGRLMAGLKRLGLDNNTMVVFTSDNGALPTFNGRRSGIYRASKLSLYEGGIRMPFIVRWLGQTPQDRLDSTSVLTAYDMLPTFCRLANVKDPLSKNGDGKDKSDVLKGKISTEKRTVFWEYGRNETAFKYPEGKDRSPYLAIRQGDWKLLTNANGNQTELYNLKTDPSETTNLVEKKPKLVIELKAKVSAWRKSMPLMR